MKLIELVSQVKYWYCMGASSDKDFKPMTAEEIQNANVGQVKKLNSQIHIAEYDEKWPVKFAELEELISNALSKLEITVEHVGSTSVPGLAAKPIIDIVMEVPDSSCESDYCPPLEAAGFFLKIREPDWFEHRMFKDADQTVNLHVFSKGCTEVTKMIQFRDHLRNNPVDLNLYLSKKRELASQTWEYTQNYADAKTEVVKDINSRIKA